MAEGTDPLERPLRHALALAVLVGLGAGLLPASNWRWGMNLLRYYPPLAAALLAAAALVVILAAPPLRAAWGAPRWLERRAAPWLVALGVALLGALFFQAARAHSYLLGDGYEIIRRLRQDNPAVAARSPILNLLLPPLFRLSGGLDPVRSGMAAGQLSLLAGVLGWGGAAFFLARAARRAPLGALTAAVLLLVTPVAQLFCGYVESYAPLTAALLVFCAAGFDRLTGGGRSALAAALAAQLLAFSGHPFGVALVPATLFLLAWRPDERVPGALRRRLLVALGALVALGLVLGVFFAFFPRLRAVGQAVRYLAPQEHVTLLVNLVAQLFDARPWADTYRINSWLHLADVFNTAWLCGAAGLAWLVALALQPAGRRALRATPVLFVALLLPAELGFRALLRTPLGAARDWDLFSGLGLALTSLAAASALAGAGRRLAWPALAAGLFFTLPWLGVQMSDGRSAARHFEGIEAAPVPEPFVLSGYHGVMGDRLVEVGQPALAEAAYARSLQAYPRYEYAWRLGVVEMALRNYDRARFAFARAAQLDPDNREALTELGAAYAGLGRLAAADSVLARVVALYPRDAGEALIYRARVHFHAGDDAQGRRWLEEARRTLPPGDAAWRDLRALEDELRAAAAGGVPSLPAVAPAGTPPTPR